MFRSGIAVIGLLVMVGVSPGVERQVDANTEVVMTQDPAQGGAQDRARGPGDGGGVDRSGRGRPDHRGGGVEPPWGRRGEMDRSRGRFDRERNELTEEFRSAFLAVARDVRPMSAEDEQRLMVMPLEEFRGLVMKQGMGRVFYLVRMRESQPELYQLKVRELRLGREVGQLTRAYHAAIEAGDSIVAERALGQVRIRVGEQYDLRLKTRQQEIVHLERRITAMRVALEEDEEGRAGQIDGWIERIKQRPASDRPGGPDHRGDGAPRRRGDG